MSWQRAWLPTVCTKCAAVIGEAEPLYVGEMVPGLKYCPDCAKRDLFLDVPVDLPSIEPGRKHMAKAPLVSRAKRIEAEKDAAMTPLRLVASELPRDWARAAAGDQD